MPISQAVWLFGTFESHNCHLCLWHMDRSNNVESHLGCLSTAGIAWDVGSAGKAALLIQALWTYLLDILDLQLLE